MKRQLSFDPAIVKSVVEIAIERPVGGQVRVARELKKQDLSVSPFGVRSVWLRHDLGTVKKRLNALEAKSAQEGVVLIEAQVAAQEKAKLDKEPTASSRASVRATAWRRTSYDRRPSFPG